jgi:hypothetical protein
MLPLVANFFRAGRILVNEGSQEKVSRLTTARKEEKAMKSTTNERAKWGVLFLGIVVAWMVLSGPLMAQPLISTKGGLMNVIEGQADVQHPQDMRWEKVKPLMQLRRGDTLRTRDMAHVEMLLNPGSFARLAGETMVRLVNDRLTDLSLELLDGSMEVQASGLKTIRQIEVTVKGQKFLIVKDGVYRFDVRDSGVASARVYRGEMRALLASGKITTLKKSKEALIDLSTGAVAFNHFDAKALDDLSQWSAYRDSLLASANSRVGRGLGGGYWSAFGFNPFIYGGGWFYNPLYGYYTYLPGYGYGFSGYCSPYGYHYPIIIVGGGGGTYRTENIARVRESINSGAFSSNKSYSGEYSSAPSWYSGSPSVMSAPAQSGASGGGRSEGAGSREGRH